MYKKIYVEITNSCNLNCSFCIGNKRKKEFITKDKFNELCKKINGYTDYIYLHVMGEPLLHPQINELINIASNTFKINITTNGYLINKIADNPNIRQINISLHSYNENNNKTLDEYLNDIFNTVDKLKVMNTYISYRLWTNSKYKKDIIKKLEERYNIRINDKKKVTLSDNIFYEVEEEFIWPDLNNNYYNEEGSCMGCRSHIGILVDGTVVPCCLDSAGIINLGNIYKQDISDIICSNLYQEIKNGFLNNKKIHELCKKCNFYNIRKQ